MSSSSFVAGIAIGVGIASIAGITSSHIATKDLEKANTKLVQANEACASKVETIERTLLLSR